MKIASGAAATAFLHRQVAAQARTVPGSAAASSIVASDSAAIAGTTHGKVRGFIHGEMFIFRGIPYGAPTSGAGRFMAPAKPAPWSGVRSALAWGFASPQIPPEHWDKDEVAFVYEWNPGAQGEDCLRLNVWTPGLDNRKRAVMVWLHGGGFATGSGNEMNVYDGENLAGHDVVVVSLNHRLGAVGFLDLSPIGGVRYAASGNVGLLDILAALEWVRDNIAAFGGDPAKVTVFGQSGGGGKVTALMAMPRAKGLFHKAIVESGSMRRMLTPDFSAKLADAVLKEAGVSRARLQALQDMPFERFVAAAKVAASKIYPAGDYSRPIDFGRHCEFNAWGPTVQWQPPARTSILDFRAGGVGRRAADRRLDAHRIRGRLRWSRIRNTLVRRVPRPHRQRPREGTRPAHSRCAPAWTSRRQCREALCYLVLSGRPPRGRAAGRAEGRAGRRAGIPVLVCLGQSHP